MNNDNTFFEKAQWKWAGGFRDKKIYKQFGEQLKIHTDEKDYNLETNDGIVYLTKGLAEIYEDEVRSFYSSPAIKPKFTFIDYVCDLWSAIFEREDEDDEEKFKSHFPSEFIIWLCHEYGDIVVEFYSDPNHNHLSKAYRDMTRTGYELTEQKKILKQNKLF